MKEENKKEYSFEESMARLNEIVEKLDDDNTSLDDSLKLFEEGVKLIGICNSKLNEAEQKIKIIENGEEKDFEV